jgi:hypothetical protein
MKYLTALILIGLASVLLAGFTPVGHISHHVADASVEKPCPITYFSNIACADSSTAIPVDSTFASFLLLVPVFVAFVFCTTFVAKRYLLRWLSLFEHSPSFA